MLDFTLDFTLYFTPDFTIITVSIPLRLVTSDLDPAHAPSSFPPSLHLMPPSLMSQPADNNTIRASMQMLRLMGTQGWRDKALRESLGDNPDTSKALGM